MKKMYQSLCVIMLLVLAFQSRAQIATTISGGSSAAGSYTDFASAIAALNGSTITGPVTVDVTAGQTENLSGKITLTATGTSVNTITIQKSGAGANPKLISYTGSVTTPSVVADGFFVMAGSDYVTIDGIDLQENTANTTTATVMEFGYGLFKASTTDGCQYNIIKNCTITLNRIQNASWTAPGHNGSCGIAVLNGLNSATGAITPTSINGSNSFNKFYSNTIQNCNAGIVFIGFAASAPFTYGDGQFGDTGNDIGGNLATTGNTILNFGGGASTNPATGIFANNQWNMNLSYNTINNNNGSGVNHTTTLRGVFMNSSSIGANVNCNYNTITIKGGGTTSQITGIESLFGALSAGISNTVNLNYNTVNMEYSTATTGVNYGIYHNTNAPVNLNMNNNTVNFSNSSSTGAVNGVWNSTIVSGALNMNNNTVSATLGGVSGTLNCVYNSGAAPGIVNMMNNVIGPISLTHTASSYGFRGTYISTGSALATLNMSGNTLTSIVYGGTNTGFFSAFGNNGTVLSETVQNNTMSNITIPCSGAVRFLDVSNSTATGSISGNSCTNFINNNATGSTSAFQLIYNFGVPGTSTTGLQIFNNTFTNITCNRTTNTIGSSAGPSAIFWGTGASAVQHIYNNTINGFTNIGIGYVMGIFQAYGTTNNCYENTLSNISSAGNSAAIVAGNSSTSNINVYQNNISGISSSSATGVAFGIVVGTAAGSGPTAVVNVYRNKICSVSQTGTSGIAEGIRMFKGATSNIYNNIIGGITAANSTNGTAVVGLNIASTSVDIYRVYFNTVHLTGTGGVNFGSASVLLNTAPSTDLRNNIFSNMTVPTGTGLAVGHRRSSTSLTNFASGSNNNMWYSGTPSASNLMFFDGTNADQTITDYQTRVAPREGASFTTDLSTNFLSTSCSSPSLLHIDANIPTQLEGGAVTISTPAITTDFDGDARGITPDVGADEFNGITPAPAIANLSMSPGTANNCVATARDVYVDVTTLSGFITNVQINFSFNGGAQTPVILTNIGGDTYYGQIPPAVPGSATVTWSVSATNSLSLTTGLSGPSYSDELLGTMSVTATASVNPVCSGSGTVLTASVTYPGGSTKILGAGALTNATYPNPFYSLYSNTHNQYLVLASELTALGILPGNIESLGINLTDKGTLPMLDFSMKIGTTTASSLSGFQSSSWSTVYTSASFMPVIGINTMNFTTPFYWDGTSNIVVEFCHGNSASTATMSRVCQADNTPFISCIHTHNLAATTGTTQCTDNTSNVLTYSVRPRFYFNVPIATSNFNWNDGLNNIGNTASITVNPLNTTTYSCSMDALGCSTSATVVVTAIPVPAAPTAVNSTQCGVAIPTAYVSSNAGVSGTGQYYWYDQALNGTLLQGPPMGTTVSSFYFNDFSSATLSNASSIAGNASITGGILQLTPNLTSQTGGITVFGPGSYVPTLFTVEFDATNSPAGLADGFSYSFSDDGSATSTTPTNAELGTGSKLRVGFDTYGTGVGAAGIYLLYGPNVINSPGQTVGTNGILAYSNNITWVNASNVHVTINIDAAGLCTVSLGATTIFSNVQLPADFMSTNKSSWSHIIKARTGGIAGSFIIDNLNIQTNQPAAGTPTYLSNVGTTTTFHVAEMSTDGCPTLRTPVTVTVTTPPVLTITPGKLICNDYVQALSVTSDSTLYNSYIWSPSTNLFTDAAGTIPYTGTSATTVYFRTTTAGSYPITINVSEPVNGCMNTLTTTMSVLPGSITVSANPENLCVTGNTVLSFTPTTNLFTATRQWSSSPDGINYTPISGANGLTYSATGLTASTYYLMTITDDNNAACLMNNTLMVVNNPAIISTTPGTRCGTGTVTLEATPGGAAIINWYQNATGGAPLSSGVTFTTPSISTTTTYYAAPVEGGTTASLGLANRVGATTNSGYSDIGLMFNAVQNFTLNSVAVYPVATTPSGNVSMTIALKNSAGTILQQTTVSVPTSVSPGIKTTVPLNFYVPAGTGHRLVFTAATGGGITGFIREVTTGYTYPYTLASVASITSAYTGGASSAYYYYFYDWLVSYGCEGTRVPVVATVNTAPAITVANSAICEGQTATLNVMSSNPDYSYTWMPGNYTGGNVSITPLATTTYTVTAIDNTAGPYFGCQLLETQTITVNANPTLSSITSSPSSVNPGCNTPVTLEATTSAAANILVGNASSTTTTSTTAITPYSSFYESGRIQYLLTSAELNALGFSAGNISSLGFDVTATSAFNQTGYTIKMGHTSAVALSGYAAINGSLQTVYGPVLMTPPPVGVNTYNFSSPFSWNGTDNVIIEICHDNDNSANTCGTCYGTSGTVRTTVTSFNSVYGTYNDNATLCGTGVGTLTASSTTRPNIYLNGIAGQPTTKVWEPGTVTGNSITVTPTATTVYTVTCTNATTGCSTVGNVTVTLNPDATLSGLAPSYNVTATAVTMTGTPTGGVFSGPGVTGSSFDPAVAGVGTHTISYLPSGYCVPATVTVIVLPNNAILNLKCYIEGYYIGSGMMNPVLNNQGLTNPITDCDTVVVELHDATTPYATAYSFTGILQTNGTLSCTFPGAAQGNSYYLVVNHRNAMQTWSANPILLGAVTSYDFSTADTQAYGSNQAQVATGVYAFFSGDMNQDYSIDAFDYLIMDPDIYNGAGGWLVTDLNGDGSVDAFDYLIYDPNGYNGITIQAP